MSSVIILSSSPPPIFARSPTPIHISSPQKPSSSKENGDTPGRKRFKTISTARDGFDAGLSIARQILAEKNSDVNKSFSSSPGRNKFKVAQTNIVEGSQGTESGEWKPSSSQHKELPYKTPQESHQGVIDLNFTPEDPEGSFTSSPFVVQRAVSRRKDWTPPKPDTVHADHDANIQRESSFPNDLFGSFGYKSTKPSTKALAAGPDASKRRKIVNSVVDAGEPVVVQIAEPQSFVGRKASTKRSKSPSKKSLTITGLATSNFLGLDKAEESAMSQYLTSTSGQMSEDIAESGMFETKIKQTKAAVAKMRESKKRQQKSLLVSPTSALRYLEGQETVFGSASQLLNTGHKSENQATILTDSFGFSDPLFSPPHSQAVSVDSTTRHTGTTRFRQSRNLWAAAGRDEDNALLHIDDTIDLTDSPVVRAALTGKDVMVLPNMARPTIAPSESLNSAGLPVVQPKRPTVFDVDEVVSPTQSPSILSTGFHTASQSSSPRKRTTTVSRNDNASSKVVASKSGRVGNKKSVPKKPHYAGLSDHDLKKQISAYGFKAIKKREKMVELLEKCWVEKHGSTSQASELDNEKSGYGDILSHIHDVSARPVPKAKKVTKPRKKKTEATKSTPGKPKSSENVTLPTAKKVVRKRKSKSDMASEERVYNIEDFDDPAVKERRELGRFDDWARPPRTSKVPPAVPEFVGPHTPPLSFPETSKAAVEASQPLNKQMRPTNIPTTSTEAPEEALPTPNDTQQPNILEQITRAINHESFTANVQIISPSKSSSSSNTATATALARRNHQTNPTWHEKILMYDPIILEDLAIWLNTKGLGDIGEDREVSAIDVRTWCESRGICCLWKGGWRGQKGGE